MPLCKRVVRLIMEVILSRRIGGTKRHGRLRVIIRCKREKNSFVKIIYIVVVVCFLLLHTSYTRNKGGMCYTTKCDMAEDGSIGRASESNPDG
jgi:hypothetical protein